MQPVSLPFESLEELNVRAFVDEGVLTLRLTGTADLRVATDLAALLREIHQQARSTGVHEVSVDMTELEFMNSSCFKGVATWISMLQRAETGSSYRIRFLSNRSILWQRRSLHALSCLAPELVSVDASPPVEAGAA